MTLQGHFKYLAQEGVGPNHSLKPIVFSDTQSKTTPQKQQSFYFHYHRQSCLPSLSYPSQLIKII